MGPEDDNSMDEADENRLVGSIIGTNVRNGRPGSLVLGTFPYRVRRDDRWRNRIKRIRMNLRFRTPHGDKTFGKEKKKLAEI